MRGRLAREQCERVRERWLQDVESVPATAGRSGQVHDQRLPPHAGHAATEQAVRRLPDGVGAQRLGDTGRRPLDHGLGRLGREVAWRHPGPAGREHEPRAARKLPDRGGDPGPVVGDNPVRDIETLRFEQRHEQLAALVLTLAGRHAVRDGEHTGSQTGSFVFSTSATSVTLIPLSTAFAMSYTVKAATDAAVSASISTPVCAVVSTVATISTTASCTERETPIDDRASR